MTSRRITDTRLKALDINLDASRYGTFAEIGAGQEVVRRFFSAGAASGTIAKSVSAYDMQVSDAIYGASGRYVSRARLERMLAFEYDLNIERLTTKRGRDTAFFAFADTVVARSFRGDNECHAWMGIRFQAQPRDEANQIVIHIRMLDVDNLQQQEALGIVGVNLVFGAARLSGRPELLLESLVDGLSSQRIEIDMIEFSGIEFRRVDNRVMSLRLVELGLSAAAIFSVDEGKMLQPSEVLYKRPVLVQRGSFRPPTSLHMNMLECARNAFTSLENVEESRVVGILEITMSNLKTDGKLDLGDFLDRVDILSASGLTVLISDYSRYFRLVEFLSRHTREPVGLSLGVETLEEIFKERHYEDLEGGVLESIGRLCKNNVILYAYPSLRAGKIVTAEALEVDGEVRGLYRYLFDRGSIQDLEGVDHDLLPIRSDDVLKAIRSGDDRWEEQVPPRVRDLVKERRLFGYRTS
jgi:hypothetical protein